MAVLMAIVNGAVTLALRIKWVEAVAVIDDGMGIDFFLKNNLWDCEVTYMAPFFVYIRPCILSKL